MFSANSDERNRPNAVLRSGQIFISVGVSDRIDFERFVGFYGFSKRHLDEVLCHGSNRIVWSAQQSMRDHVGFL